MSHDKNSPKTRRMGTKRKLVDDKVPFDSLQLPTCGVCFVPSSASTGHLLVGIGLVRS